MALYTVINENNYTKINGKKVNRPNNILFEYEECFFKVFYGCVIKESKLKDVIRFLIGEEIVIKKDNIYYLKSPKKVNNETCLSVQYTHDDYARFIPTVKEREFIEIEKIFHKINGEDNKIYVGFLDYAKLYSKCFHYSEHKYDYVLYPSTKVENTPNLWEQFKTIDSILNLIFNKTIFENYDYYNFEKKHIIKIDFDNLIN